MKNKDKKLIKNQKISFLNEDWQRAFLAVISSITASISTHPIETCKIKIQIQKPLDDGSKKYKNLI
jgi:hypothetical protein